MKSSLDLLKSVLGSAAIFCASSPLMLIAQEVNEKSSEAKASPWVFPYIMFVLAVFLGLAVISLPTKRSDKPKMED